MINGLGVLGWGVGGIEAEACMLGQPISMLLPPVVGFKLHGKLPEGCTATDLVLTITQMLRKKGVVGKFVEFYGTGLSALSLADRATVANMAPEYGATMGFFPVDAETLEYLRFTNRDADLVALVDAYTKAQGLFRTDATPDPVYADTLELDLGKVTPSMAGPKRPQDRVELADVRKNFHAAFPGNGKSAQAEIDGQAATFGSGAVVIAAITSCTNTSNPSVMLAAGLVAKKAVERGLTVKPWVKTSLAPGSKVVMDYYREAGLIAVSRKAPVSPGGLRLHHLHRQQRAAARTGGASGAERQPDRGGGAERKPQLRGAGESAGEGELSGVAAAGGGVRAGRERWMWISSNDPLGTDSAGTPVYLRDIWPTNQEVQDTRACGRQPRHVRARIRARLRWRRQLAGDAGADRRHLRMGRRVHLHQEAAVFREDGGPGHFHARL